MFITHVLRLLIVILRWCSGPDSLKRQEAFFIILKEEKQSLQGGDPAYLQQQNSLKT